MGHSIVASGSGVESARVRNPSVEGLVSERTRELLAKRRTGKRHHRRGWLVRRALAGADVVGLLLAFAIAQILAGGVTTGAPDRVPSWLEILAFAVTIPGWILLARAYHLYDRDEERTDHSTVDDMVGVFNMVTVGAWCFFGISTLTGVADPSFRKLFVFWTSAVVLVAIRASSHGPRAAVRTSTSRTRSSSAPATSVSASHGS